MEKNHLNLLVPGWQGGGQDISTYEGGLELKDYYLQSCQLTEVQVSKDPLSETKNDIVAYDDLLRQMKDINKCVGDKHPDTIFTIGGGCDVGIIPVSHLNNLYDGEITLLYFDAHGDMNTPRASSSKLFYGMSLRMLLGEGDSKMGELLFSTVSPSQLILLGTRDLDEAEEVFIKENQITVLPVDEIEASVNQVVEAVKQKGNGKLCIHIDLDVLEPSRFPYAPIPVADGLRDETLLNIIKELDDRFEIVGFGLLEYAPSGQREHPLVSALIQTGLNL